MSIRHLTTHSRVRTTRNPFFILIRPRSCVDDFPDKHARSKSAHARGLFARYGYYVIISSWERITRERYVSARDGVLLGGCDIVHVGGLCTVCAREWISPSFDQWLLGNGFH